MTHKEFLSKLNPNELSWFTFDIDQEIERTRPKQKNKPEKTLNIKKEITILACCYLIYRVLKEIRK